MKKNKVSGDPQNGVWKFFASVKLTVTLLLTLACTSIIGTVIPQNENPAAYFNEYGEFLYKIFGFLDIFDMYHSWWFRFLILSLTINIIVCSIDRLSSTWKIVFSKNISLDIERFRKSFKEEFSGNRTPEELSSLFMPVVSKSFKQTRVEETEKGFVIFAEKGRWTRLGVYAVHLSVILLLIGGLIGSFFGFEGSANIPEGESVRSIILRNTGREQPLDFEIRCDDFNLSFYESGAPKEYLSKLTILENGKPVYKKDIIVNDPIRFKGINIFQSSYGTLKPKEIFLSFTNRETGMIYRQRASVGEEINLPEAFGKFVIKEYSGAFDFRGHNLGEAFMGVLTPLKGDPVEVVLPVHFPSFDKMRKDQLIISVEDSERRFYTGLQVTRDPGVPVVYAGFIVMILGCFISFFMSHKRLCVEVVKKGGKTSVMVAGITNKNKLGMEVRTQKIAKLLSAKADILKG
ncbi:MAG: cytochrome c biogenesis protein ResB [Desulfobacteraceae bacterium]|nr:MAG: cytochrome c biogenesis protein ResB [Desulfobacteraceae bacterium]